MNLELLRPRVAEIMRQTAKEFIVPRFRNLKTTDVFEKSTDEPVTIADNQAESALRSALQAMLPGSRVLGEEDCSARPELLDTVGDGLIWLVDPLDGTRNFVEGSPHFAMMVALVDRGTILAGWIYQPLADSLYYAALGKGAYVDDRPLTAQTTGGIGLVGALPSRYADAAGAAMIEVLTDRIGTVLPGLMCAGADYPLCVNGGQDFAVFWRCLPWDHAAGALLVNEAGGFAGWPSGQPYSILSKAPGLIVAASPAIWRHVAEWTLHSA